MKNKNESNFFVIERLDKEEKADSISKIYNLEPLNIIKETMTQNDCKSIIKIEDAEKIRYGEKAVIIQAIKKAILSSNLSYNWYVISKKYYLLTITIIHLISLISYIIIYLYQRNNTSSSILNKNDLFTVSNTTFNFNNSINNYTNEFIDNSYYLNETNSEEDKEILWKYYFLASPIINLLLMILISIIVFFKFIPQKDETNEIIYKFTRYLLICESFKNKNYYYHLMDDYSILVIKKGYFINNKSSSDINEKLDPEKNIFLYCINYIYDYLIEDKNNYFYPNLMTKEDLISFIILKEFIDKLLERNEKIFQRIMISILVLLNSTFFYNKTLFSYISVLMGGMTMISYLIKYFYNEYYNSIEKSLDLLINLYNEYLLPRRKYIYRKNKLIMFLTLKDNTYDKKQVIKAIEKIINS